MKRSFTIKWCLLVAFLVSFCTPALALAQWGWENYYPGGGYYSSSYESSYYGSDCTCGGGDSGYGWLSSLALGSCNKIEVDDRVKF